MKQLGKINQDTNTCKNCFRILKKARVGVIDVGVFHSFLDFWAKCQKRMHNDAMLRAEYNRKPHRSAYVCKGVVHACATGLLIGG